jgi:hypothetical protein
MVTEASPLKGNKPFKINKNHHKKQLRLKLSIAIC